MAKSSRASQKTKREQVMAMAREACERNKDVFPLAIETMENVAAAIKAVGWSPGGQYINELKLMHIEASWEVSQQLSKAIADCKRSLQRDRGPVKRAPEFKLDGIEHIKWILTCRGPKRDGRTSWPTGTEEESPSTSPSRSVISRAWECAELCSAATTRPATDGAHGDYGQRCGKPFVELKESLRSSCSKTRKARSYPRRRWWRVGPWSPRRTSKVTQRGGQGPWACPYRSWLSWADGGHQWC